MLKINLHSMYTGIKSFTADQEPRFIKWVKSGGSFDMYVDDKVFGEVEPLSCALLIEPRSIQPTVYEYIEHNSDKFRVIFTHDSRLLQLPNARLIHFGGVYPSIYFPNKTKNISMVSSDKNMCELHRERLRIIKELSEKNLIDAFGTFDGGDYAKVDEYLAPYRYSVIIENYIDDYWFTEKICNCFYNCTIPIYYGARRISEIFNPLGIYQAMRLEDINKIVEYLNIYGDSEYYRRTVYIIENLGRVYGYECFEDTFYKMHMDLLKSLDVKLTGQRLKDNL